MSAWRLLALIIGDGWKQAQQVQSELMEMAQNHQATAQSNIEQYLQYGDANTRAEGSQLRQDYELTPSPQRPRVSLAPKLRNFIDDVYGLPHMRSEPKQAYPAQDQFNQHMVSPARTHVKLRPNLPAYVDDGYGFPPLSSHPPRNKNLQGQFRSRNFNYDQRMRMSQTGPQVTIQPEIQAYIDNVYADMHWRAEDTEPNAGLTERTRYPHLRADDVVLDPAKQREINKLIRQQEVEHGAIQLSHDELTDESMLARVPGAGDHRGPRWYDEDTSPDSNSDIADGGEGSVSLSTTDDKKSSGASSKETSEKRRGQRAYRTCTPCPLDMIRKYKNMGLKWICGAYQRARRSFKSECMMRYRNCQDGTMFVKIGDNRCPSKSYHGRSWFYLYKV